MTRRIRPILCGVLFLSACGGDGAPMEPPDPNASRISPFARAYLTDALDVMEDNSVRRFVIDWVQFRQATFDSAAAIGAQTSRDTYDAIRFAVEMLGDNHSSFRTPESLGSSATLATGASGSSERAIRASSVPFGEPAAHRLPGEIGYIHVPLHSSRTVGDGVLFADRIQELIRGVDGPGTCGWIVDVRGNLGGNMWPMVAGVGPVLGEDTLGFFVDPDPSVPRRAWTYENGQAASGGNVNAISTVLYELIRPDPTVAVLWEEHTASSGEAVATAFVGRPNTRSFGEPSFGLSTGNRLFLLSDGAGINLTTVTFADRTGTVYGGRIPPEVVVEHQLSDQEAPDPTVGDDPVVLAALDWLSTEGDCAAPGS